MAKYLISCYMNILKKSPFFHIWSTFSWHPRCEATISWSFLSPYIRICLCRKFEENMWPTVPHSLCKSLNRYREWLLKANLTSIFRKSYIYLSFIICLYFMKCWWVYNSMISWMSILIVNLFTLTLDYEPSTKVI